MTLNQNFIFSVTFTVFTTDIVLFLQGFHYFFTVLSDLHDVSANSCCLVSEFFTISSKITSSSIQSAKLTLCSSNGGTLGNVFIHKIGVYIAVFNSWFVPSRRFAKNNPKNFVVK